jgi:plastocyanin
MSRPRIRRRTPALAVLATLAASVVVTACSSVAAGEADPVADDQVTVVDDSFAPLHIEVPAGATVTWTWNSDRAHDVVGDDLDSGVQDTGTFAHTFHTPGTYDYRCTVHRGMTGRVTVTS